MRSEDIMLAVDAVLREWADWNREQGGSGCLGYPSKSIGFSRSGLKSWDDLCDSVTSNKMESVDSCISSLPPAQAAAVEKAYGISAVFRFPRENYHECLYDALMSLSIKFREKGVEL